MTEKNFQSFYKFLSIAKNGIIQTNFPDSILVTSLSSLNYMAFFENEILNRKKTDFPPFGHLIRLIYKNQSEAKALNEAKAVSNLIMTKADSSLKILGPSATFFQRQRGFYFQQIILKFKNKISPDIVKIVKKLPDKWTIDVDPKDLL
jgi:primosomal protein N' (replication factor Y)